MKRVKRLWAGILMAVMIFSSEGTVMAASQTSDEAIEKDDFISSDGQYTYKLTNGDAMITGYRGTANSLSVSDTIDGYPVTDIGSYAFGGCDTLTDVKLGENITGIGSCAFDGCTKLESLILPESLTDMGICIIRGTSVSSITIPKNVRNAQCTKDFGVLSGAEKLKRVVFENGMTKIPDYICANSIYNQSVYGITIAELVIPGSVTEIGQCAFCGCTSLREVDIPKRVSNIGERAFLDCTSLKQVTMHYNDELVNTETEGRQPFQVIIEAMAFSGCSSLTDVKLSENVTSIGDSAFFGCAKLESLILPDSLTTMGCGMIEGTCISSITIPQNVRVAYSDYDFGALSGAEKLKRVVFKDGMTRIPDYICACSLRQGYESSITAAFIPKSITEIGENAFYDCVNLVIYGYEDSYAKTYANENNIPFKNASEFDFGNDSDNNHHQEFNMNIYRANLLVDDNYPATKGLNDHMREDTPSEIFISTAQEKELQYAVTWKALTATLDVAGSPSHLVDFSMEEKDLYSAVILDLLQVSVKSDVASSCQDAIKDAKNVSSKVKSWMQESFNLDMAEKENFNAMTNEQKKALIAKTKEEFKKQYDKDLSSMDKTLSNFSNILAAADCIETYLEDIATICELAKISDSMKVVIDEMYQNCPESKKALKSALKECVSIINASADQFIDKLVKCTEKYIGLQAVKFGVDEIWNMVRNRINFSNPTLFILTEVYKVDKYVANELFNTDAISEQYMDMLAVADVEDLIRKVLQSSKSRYKNKPVENNAKAYLSAIDFFYAGLDYDCKSAYKYVDAVDDALVSQIAALWGIDHGDVKKNINSIQQKYYSNYVNSILSSWIYNLDADYPNSGLYEQYEPLLNKNYEKAVTKKYGVACPVDVFVYDKNNKLVAYVKDNKPYSAGDITVVVEGTSKTLYFFDDDQYHIKYVGTDTGDMEANMEEYDQAGNIIRKVDYSKIPLSDGIIYETEIKGDGKITLLKDKEGKILTADLDTNVLSGNNRKVQIENGVLLSEDGPVFSAEVPFNNEVSVYAYIPEGYTFEHWTSDAGTDVFEDSASRTTTFKMPNHDIKISAILTKKQVKVEKVALSLLSQGIESGKALRLTATVEPQNADNGSLNWTSDNPSVAVVDSNGLVTAVAPGQATITVSSTDGSNVSASCIITVTKSGSVTQPGGDNSSGGNSSGGSSSSGGSTGDIPSGDSISNNNSNSSDNKPDTSVQIKLLYYIVEFNANAGTELSRKTMTLLNDDNLGILPKVQRKNYSFKGWYTQKSGGTKVNSDTVLNAGTTLFAQWQKVKKPSKVKVLSLKSSKKGRLVVRFQKAGKADGYEIFYSTDKKFPSSLTKKTVTASAKKTLQKLKSGKKYYVRIRAYKLDSAGKKVYGKYSKVETVRVK